MTALEILLPGGQKKKLVVRRPAEWVFKRNPRAARDEFRALQLVQSVGVTTAEPYYGY